MRINQELLERLRTKLGLSQSRVYALVDEKVRTAHLPRHLAAIALAAERGINISKFALAEDLAVIRHAAVSAAPAPVVVSHTAPGIDVKFRAKRRAAAKRATQPRRGTTVFVVHGRNYKLRDAVFAFLRSIGLRPLEWTQALRLTKQPSPYVGTVLETAFREAAAVVVLLTPDDEAKLKAEFVTPRDPTYETRLTGQARPNVLFEAGMAFGKDPNSTVLVQVGDVRPFSDVAGRHVVHLSNEATSRQELVTKLANAGCNVDTTGADWLSAGDFRLSAPNRPPRQPKGDER